MYQLHIASSELDWSFYGPVLGMVMLILLGVPIWVALGLGTALLLSLTEVLPLTLVGETLFSGIDSFSLIAVPLFILTGDVIVHAPVGEAPRSGGGHPGLDQIRVWHIDSIGVWLFRVHFGFRCCGRGGDWPYYGAAPGEEGVSFALCQRACRKRRDDGHPYPALDLIHHHRPDARHFRLDAISGGGDTRPVGPDHHHRDQHAGESGERL